MSFKTGSANLVFILQLKSEKLQFRVVSVFTDRAQRIYALAVMSYRIDIQNASLDVA